MREIKDPKFHIKLALNAFKKGNFYLAYAELKTAEVLGADYKDIKNYLIDSFNFIVNDIRNMDHNQYFRYKSLSEKLLNLEPEGKFSILDVGGGEGKLSCFLPKNVKYCLVEPSVNFISSENLFFDDKSFDYVVSCHVLEHIPELERNSFLSNLLSKSRKGLILLNPFTNKNLDNISRHSLVYEITSASWAKEHLECNLPTLDFIKQFAHANNLELSIEQNGTLTTSLAFVFLSYFAYKANCEEELKKINYYFNTELYKTMNSSLYPTGYLIYMRRK